MSEERWTHESHLKTTTGDGIPIFCAFDELVKLDQIKPNPRNPNTHPDGQIKMLAKIIRGQGWRAPITISQRSGLIVRGHGRLLAAQRLGSPDAPVDYQPYQSQEEEWADLVADNRLAELAQIDTTLLLDLLEEIDTGSIELYLTGYTEEDYQELLSAAAGERDTVPTQEDDIPALPEQTIVNPGDIWELGPHRLMCGDSTNQNQVRRLMRGDQAAMVFTDPPYGVDYESASGKHARIAGDELRYDDLLNKLLIPAFKNMVEATDPKGAFYIWHASSTRKDFDAALDAAGLQEKQYIVWVKPQFVLGRADYHWSHEPCYYACREGTSQNFYGDRSNSTVWRATLAQEGRATTSLGMGLVLLDGRGGRLYLAPKAPKGKKTRHIRLTKDGHTIAVQQEGQGTTAWEVGRDAKPDHPTQKPVELARRAIENSSRKGELVLDLFAGSGGTLLAAEFTGRAARCMELDPGYCDVILRRYEAWAKQKPIRVERGSCAGAVEEAR